MKELLLAVERLKTGEIKKLVDGRIREFKELGEKQSKELFKELCFCILTANFNAERSINIQRSMGDDFLSLPESMLAKKLKELGHRFPNTRAKYITEARMHADIKNIINSLNKNEIREWLVANIKGLGYKEASHFLRNIGFTDFAIIDFHIIDILEKNKLIERPKTLTKKKYLEIEQLLGKLAKKLGMSLAELDLYLWYMETGKVLK